MAYDKMNPTTQPRESPAEPKHLPTNPIDAAQDAVDTTGKVRASTFRDRKCPVSMNAGLVREVFQGPNFPAMDLIRTSEANGPESSGVEKYLEAQALARRLGMQVIAAAPLAAFQSPARTVAALAGESRHVSIRASPATPCSPRSANVPARRPRSGEASPRTRRRQI
jgi:hypothetical protein